MGTTITSESSFAGPEVTVYGKDISNLTPTGVYGEITATNVARVYGYKLNYGSSSPCRRFPNPIWMPVAGAGTALPAEGECGYDQGEFLKWKLPRANAVVAMHPTTASIEDIFEEVSILGISGSVDIRNVEISGGKVHLDIVFKAKIKVLGQEAKFSHTIHTSVGLNGVCVTPWDNSWASLEVCATPSQVTAELCAKKFGLEKCWKSSAGIGLYCVPDACAPHPICPPDPCPTPSPHPTACTSCQ